MAINPFVPRVEKIKIRQLALTDFYWKWIMVMEMVDVDTHYCEL